jgi:magnesium transporter
MMLNWITSDGVSNHALAELPDLRKRTDGFLWLDIPEWRDEAEEILTNEFHFHPMAITESKSRSHIPRVHVYPDHVFIVLHAPEAQRATCTISSWTRSSGRTTWSPCTAL